jgi:uncharacterized membrane protein required for colicin V production
MTQWTVLDYIFIAITLLSTAMAFYKGLARELISLAALIIGFILAAVYYRQIGSGISSGVSLQA